MCKKFALFAFALNLALKLPYSFCFYCCIGMLLIDITESSVQPSSPQHGDNDTSSDTSTDPCTDPLVADVKVVGEIQDLESDFSHMYSEVRDVLANCDVAKAKFFLKDILDTDEFKDCHDIDDLLQQLRRIIMSTHSMCTISDNLSAYSTLMLISSSLSMNMKKNKRIFSKPRQSKISNMLS